MVATGRDSSESPLRAGAQACGGLVANSPALLEQSGDRGTHPLKLFKKGDDKWLRKK